MESIREDLQESDGRKTAGDLDCTFCRILRGEAPEPLNYVVESNIASFTPPDPVIPGHRLFIPCFHAQDAADSPFTSGLVFMAASYYASKRRNDFNLITCAGSWASQAVMHFHVHYVPRNPTDKLKLPWS